MQHQPIFRKEGSSKQTKVLPLLQFQKQALWRTCQKKDRIEDSLSPTVKKGSALSVTSAPPLAPDTTLPTVTRRVSSKQRKLSLDEYRATFLQVPKVVNRRPVFVSEEVRQQLDLTVLRLSETRRMSVTGLLENICRHHIAMYEDDIEQWRKL